MMLFLYKAMLYSTPVFLLSFYTGYSGITYITDLLQGLYEVILTTFAVNTYLLLEQDVSFKDSIPGSDHQSEFPTRLLPALYNYKIKTHLGKKLQRFLLWSVFTWYSSLIMFYIPFYALDGIIDAQGRTGGFWKSGVASFSILLAVHHGSIWIISRNYTVITVALGLFSIACFMPITLVLNDVDAGSRTYGVVFSELLPNSLFWLTQFVAVGAICLPIYAAKVYEMYLKSPEFYQP